MRGRDRHGATSRGNQAAPLHVLPGGLERIGPHLQRRHHRCKVWPLGAFLWHMHCILTIHRQLWHGSHRCRPVALASLRTPAAPRERANVTASAIAGRPASHRTVCASGQCSPQGPVVSHGHTPEDQHSGWWRCQLAAHRHVGLARPPQEPKSAMA
jgi:hypothetical protein